MAALDIPLISEKILLDLSPVDLVAACKTNRNTFAICNDETFWRNKYRRDFKELLKLRDNWKDSYLLRASIYGQYAVNIVNGLRECMNTVFMKKNAIFWSYDPERDNYYYLLALTPEQARSIYREYESKDDEEILLQQINRSFEQYAETGKSDVILNFYYGNYFVNLQNVTMVNLGTEYRKQLGISEVYDSCSIKVDNLAYNGEEGKIYLYAESGSKVDARFYRPGKVDNIQLIELDPKVIDDPIFDSILSQLQSTYIRKGIIPVLMKIFPNPTYTQYRIYLEYESDFITITTIDNPFFRDEIIALLAKLTPRIRFSKMKNVQEYLKNDSFSSNKFKIQQDIQNDLFMLSKDEIVASVRGHYHYRFTDEIPKLVEPKLKQIFNQYTDNDQLTILVRKLMEILVMELQYVI